MNVTKLSKMEPIKLTPQPIISPRSGSKTEKSLFAKYLLYSKDYAEYVMHFKEQITCGEKTLLKSLGIDSVIITKPVDKRQGGSVELMGNGSLLKAFCSEDTNGMREYINNLRERFQK